MSSAGAMALEGQCSNKESCKAVRCLRRRRTCPDCAAWDPCAVISEQSGFRGGNAMPYQYMHDNKVPCYFSGLRLEIRLTQYENGTRVRSKVIEKLKDVILISNLAKATVAAVVEPKAASKRKRLTKRIKKK
ncbi:hypothetical protein F0562_019708 [Nyssa sinensis]|uniref:Uncharacterized protein n=1 Tax=Nyssa sinensis TaxID=561372 RepID=A0A5J5BSZ4_9ASTE|nr:hypothetical protein F0562_019708 [Nyssa sinensis]